MCCLSVNIRPWVLFLGEALYVLNDYRLFIYIYIYICIKLATIVESDQKAPFPIATKPRCWGLLHFTPDMYLILLSVKQGGSKYHY